MRELLSNLQRSVHKAMVREAGKRLRRASLSGRWSWRRNLHQIVSVFAVACTLALGGVAAASAPLDFGDARWLWPAELGVATNTVVEFRQTFAADQSSSARLAIAADTVYHVELNGRAVYWGRFPDVPPRRFYDILPLGDVRPGENELKVSVYAQGADSFQTLPGDHGVMFAVAGKGVNAASGTNTTWRISSRDRREGVPLVTSQLGFSFEFDANRPAADWKRVGVADAKRDAHFFSLRERPVPRVEILPAIASRIVGQGRLDGSPVPDDVAPGMDATQMMEAPRNEFFAEDGASVNSRFFEDGFYVLVDLGREECGFLTLDVDTDAGTVIDIGHAEHAEEGRIRTFIGPRRFAGRYHAREGRQKYCRWEKRMAGRYIQLHVRDARTRFVLNGVSVHPAVFPAKERPTPAGLSPKEKAIWDVGVRTLRLCMHEHYEDCPWREQALYANDARIQMLAGYFAFDSDNNMPELAIELLSRGLDEKGWLELCMPARTGLAIPSFTFSWVLALGDHLTYRHNLEFTESMMPVLRTIMDMRAGELVDGLLPCPCGKRYWQFYDWEKDLSGNLSDVLSGSDCSIENRFDAPLNLFAVLAFESAARCAAAVREPETAMRWRQVADSMRMAVLKRFWNGEKRQIETRLGASLAPAELCQSLALLVDAIPKDERSYVVKKLSSPSDWTKTSLSQSLYKFEALCLAGEESERAMWKEMEDTWSAMLDAGATSFWEVSDGWTAFGNAGSLCHGWAAIPVYFYGRKQRRMVEYGGKGIDPSDR